LTTLNLTFGLYEIVFPLGLDQVPGSLGQARHQQQDDRQVAGSAHHWLLTTHARYSSLYSDLQLLEKMLTQKVDAKFKSTALWEIKVFSVFCSEV
jgi:hypothetical protein